MNRSGLLALALSGPQPSAQDVRDLLAFHKSWVPAGATMTGPDGEQTGGTGGEGGGDGSGSKTFTEAEVAARAAREKSQGERAGRAAERKALLEVLGLPEDTTAEALQAKLASIKSAEDAQKTEAQRAREAADAEKVAASKEKSDAAAEKHAAAVERHLVRAGVGAGETDDAKLAKAIERATRLVDVEVGADAEKIAAAVASLKTDMPALFTATTAPPPDGDTGGGPPAGGGSGNNGSGKSAVSKGREEAIRLGWVKEKQTA